MNIYFVTRMRMTHDKGTIDVKLRWFMIQNNYFITHQPVAIMAKNNKIIIVGNYLNTISQSAKTYIQLDRFWKYARNLRIKLPPARTSESSSKNCETVDTIIW